MNKTILVVICLIVTVAVVPLFAHGNKPTPVEKYFETAGKHPHAIAVNAGDRAWGGLACAAAHSPAIGTSPCDKGDKDKGEKDKGGKNEVKPGKK
jgi:hypothetical protein